MKRSQMVERMTEAWICYQENEGIKDLNKLMDKVLQTCEEEGMKPPIKDTDFPIQTDLKDGNKRLYYPITNWEPEVLNEEK